MPRAPSAHAVIRRAYRAFADRDLEGLRALALPETEVRTMTGTLAQKSEPYRGYEGLERYLADVADIWDELELVPVEFHDLGEERVLVLGRVRAKRGSTLIDSPNAWVWRIREGRVLEVEVFGDPDAAIRLLGEAGD